MLHPLAQLQAHWLCGLRRAVALSSGLVHLLLHTLHKVSQPGRLIIPGAPLVVSASCLDAAATSHCTWHYLPYLSSSMARCIWTRKLTPSVDNASMESLTGSRPLTPPLKSCLAAAVVIYRCEVSLSCKGVEAAGAHLKLSQRLIYSLPPLPDILCFTVVFVVQGPLELAIKFLPGEEGRSV